MEKREQILDLYYNKHYKQIEIARKLEVTRQYVSQIVKKDNRYESEIENRKYMQDERIINIMYIKKGKNKSLNNTSITIPVNWLRRLNFSEDDKQAIIRIVDNNKIVIEKYHNKNI